MFVQNKDEAKAALRAGKIVYGDRQIGKTTALIEVIHEDYSGDVIVTTPNALIGELFAARYGEMFPDDKQPRIENSRNAGRGSSQPLYADCYAMFPEERKRDLDSRLAEAIW